MKKKKKQQNLKKKKPKKRKTDQIPGDKQNYIKEEFDFKVKKEPKTGKVYYNIKKKHENKNNPNIINDNNNKTNKDNLENNNFKISQNKIKPKKNSKSKDKKTKNTYKESNNSEDLESNIDKDKCKLKNVVDTKEIDRFYIEKNLDFSKNNLLYSWEEMEFITEFNKKYEKGNIVYLACSKRGTNSDTCKGKAKYNKKSGLVQIYEYCTNNINLHYNLNFDEFKEMYNKNNYDNLDMSLKIFQKYYVKCLLIDNKANTFLECADKFKTRFNDIKFILNKENISKIKTSIHGNTKYSNIIELTKSLKLMNNDINIDIYPIKIETINKKKKIL